MFTHEAVVFPIVNGETDPKGLDRLAEFVEDNGGKMVDGVHDLKSAYEVMRDDHFENRIGGANVVVIADSIQPLNRHNRWFDTSGQFAFREGHRQGRLSRADVASHIGVMTIGYTPSVNSGIELVTGGNLSRLHEADASERWAAVLAPHPEKPTYLQDGAIERKIWSDNQSLSEIMHQALHHSAWETDAEKPWKTVPKSVIVHSLTARETVSLGSEELTTHEVVDAPVELSIGRLVTATAAWQEAAKGYLDLRVNAQTIGAVVQAGSHLYVVNRTSNVNNGMTDSRLDQHGRTDRIAVASLDQLPLEYWKNQGLDRPVAA